jgi:hypothetical protein
MSGARVRFEAELQPEGGGTFVIIPEDVVAAIGATGRTSVVGTIDGRPFKNQFMPYRDDSPAGRRFYMAVSKAVRAELGGREPGDVVVLDLERDDRPRGVGSR